MNRMCFNYGDFAIFCQKCNKMHDLDEYPIINLSFAT